MFFFGKQIKHHCSTDESRRNICYQFFKYLLIFLRRTYDFICDSIFNLIYCCVEVKKIPPINDPLLKESAVCLAEKIRNGEVNNLIKHELNFLIHSVILK